MKLTNEEVVEKYGKQPVIEAFTPSSLHDYSRLNTREGLVWDMGMLMVTVQNSEGQKFGLTRGYEKTMSGLWMSSRFNPDVTHASPRLFQRQYTGPIMYDLDEDQQTAKIESWPAKHNFKLDIQVGKIHWEEENGALNLELNSLGPALLYKDLGDGDYQGDVSTHESFEIKGALNGEEVSGLGVLMLAWYPAGIGFYHTTLYTHIQQSWIPWITRYEGGSIEYGSKALFAGDVNWGFYVKDGTPILGETCSIDTRWGDADGVDIPLEAEIQYGDHSFNWMADGRMAIAKGNMNWISGKMINKAKKAKPVETFAWNEFRAGV